MPADQPATDCVNEPLSWMKATCVPWGAGGLPEVKRGAVGRDAGRACEGPGRAGRVGNKRARPNGYRLKVWVAHRGRRRRRCDGDRDGVKKSRVVAAGGIQAEELDGVGPRGYRERGR